MGGMRAWGYEDMVSGQRGRGRENVIAEKWKLVGMKRG